MNVSNMAILIIAAVLLSLPLVLSAAFCVEERWGFLSRKHDKCIDEHYDNRQTDKYELSTIQIQAYFTNIHRKNYKN